VPFQKPLPFILAVILCLAPFMVNVQAESWGWGWSKVASPTSVTLNSVYAISSNEAWAVGFDGVIIKWDGTKWSNVASPTNYKLVSIDILSSNEGWAIAQRIDGYLTNQSIIMWDGISWSNMTSPTGSWLQSVDFVSSTDGWIVGADGNIFQWTTQPLPFPWIPLVVIAAIVVAAAIVAYFLIRKRVHHAGQHI
jgi:hypothetical protein